MTEPRRLSAGPSAPPGDHRARARHAQDPRRRARDGRSLDAVGPDRLLVIGARQRPLAAPVPAGGAASTTSASSGSSAAPESGGGGTSPTLAVPAAIGTASAPAAAPSRRSSSATVAANSSASPPPTPAQQVVTVLAPLRSSLDGTHEVTIGLEPEGLGTVKATITVSAGQVVVQLGADNDQARDALRQALPLLKHELGGDGSSASVLLSGDGR